MDTFQIGPGCLSNDQGLAPMRTIKIPLTAFGGDLSSVTRVQIR